MAKARIYEEWVWHCPNCAERNCAEVVPAELSVEEQVELREDYDIGYVPGALLTHPSTVTCCECDKTFEVEVGQ